MASDDFDERIAGVASLAEPQRRALYRFVVERGEAVSKDEAAAAMGVARSVAAFHLDRLVADGLLTTEFRRLTGRQGPGAGRPAKLYRRSEGELSVSLPARQYDLAAGLLAAAVSDATHTGTLGYWIGSPYAGRGFMKEAAAMMAEFAFRELHLHRIEATCMPENEPSLKLLRGVGMQEIGLARRYMKINGEWRDHLLFEKIRN